MKTPVHQCAWEEFWDYQDVDYESRIWARTQDEDDRRVLELEVEAMIEQSVPKDLEALRYAYTACDWSSIPKNADLDLRSAILAVAIGEGELDFRRVFDRLQVAPILVLGEREAPRAEVELPFPRHHLDLFVACLDHYASRTIREFEMSYRYFLQSFPTALSKKS